LSINACLTFDVDAEAPILAESGLYTIRVYDSGDTLHPNDAGYEAMGNAIDLTLFH